MLTAWLNKYKHTLILILIIAIAVFFRFWQFNSIPPGLYQDEAMNGADALSSLENGKFNIFYTNNNGREGMIVWLDALAIKFFGTEPWVLRLFPAIAGVLAVLGLFFLTKLLFSIEIALASSFFMAISFWAVNFSRIGFRAGLMLPFLIWSFYFLLRGLKKLSEVRLRGFLKSDFFIAGVLFGLGFYTYISYRFASVLATVFFIIYITKHREKNLWLKFAIFLITAFIVALPIGLHFLNNPGDFFGRSGQVSILSADNPLKSAALSVAATLGMFNVIGDLNWRHNFSGSPQLIWPVGILFLLGVGISIKRFEFSEKILMLWLFVFLLPNILTTEGNPHALRAIGAAPVAMIFSSIGLVWIYEKFKKFIEDRGKRIKRESFLLLIIFMFFISALEFDKYFLRWPENINAIESFSRNQVEISNYLNSLPDSVLKYVIWHQNDKPTSNGLPVSAQTVYFLSHGKSNINYVKADRFDKIKLNGNSAVIAPLYFDLELLHELNKKFPEGKVEFIYLNTPILIVP